MTNDALDQQVREALGRSVMEQELRVEADPVAAVHRRVVSRRRRRRVITGAVLVGVAALGTTTAILARNDGDRAEDLRVVTPPATVDTSDSKGVEALPQAPIKVRGDAALIWTGTEVVVWSGRNGAAFAPRTRTWRVLSPSPLPNSSETPVGVMTHAGVLIARGRATALWDPARDRWRTLEDAPAGVHDLVSNGLAVLSYSANGSLDVETGKWRTLPAPPVRLERPTTAWTGRELFVIGGPGTPFTAAAAIVYNPERDEWRSLPPPPGKLRAEALTADWDGKRVVVVNYDMRAVTFDPAVDSWGALPSVPARFSEWVPTLRSAGGKSVAFMASAVVVLTEGNRWVPLPYGEIRFGTVATTRPTAGVQGGGDRLFVWGLDTARDTNVLTALNLRRLVDRPRRVQVGVGSVELPEGFSIVDAAFSSAGVQEAVEVVLTESDRDRCTVSSRYGGTPSDHQVEEVLRNDGKRTQWSRDPAGRTWQTAATTSDVFTVSCTTRTTAEALAKSASFGTR